MRIIEQSITREKLQGRTTYVLRVRIGGIEYGERIEEQAEFARPVPVGVIWNEMAHRIVHHVTEQINQIRD